MAAPIVSFWNAGNTAQVTSLDFGTVDAGSVSTDTTLLIWNNKGGASAVAEMYNCTITTKDNSGGDTGELIVNKWVEVKVDSMNELTFTPIGGVTTKLIQASGQTGAKILGSINDGSVGAVANHAKVTLHANVPATATAGQVNYLTRVAYQFN